MCYYTNWSLTDLHRPAEGRVGRNTNVLMDILPNINVNILKNKYNKLKIYIKAERLSSIYMLSFSSVFEN